MRAIIKKYLTNNRCYTSIKTIKPTKLILHSTGSANPDNTVYFNNWNKASSSVSVHGIIGLQGIWQTLPWDARGWHVGSGKKGSYNNNAIGIEICEPKGHKYLVGSTMIGYNVKNNEDYFNRVYTDAVELFAFLCKEYKLDPMKDILCHSEVHKLGYGSNHGDVMHWFPKHGKSMDTFRKDVKEEMKFSVETIPSPIAPDAKTGYVRVIVPELNVRKNLSWSENSVAQVVKKGEVFTLASDKIKVGDGYMYKLKSGLYITASEKYVEVFYK